MLYIIRRNYYAILNVCQYLHFLKSVRIILLGEGVHVSKKALSLKTIEVIWGIKADMS